MNRTTSALALLLVLATATATPQEQHLRPWASVGSKGDFAIGPNERSTAVFRNSQAPREVQTINRDWTFNYFPDEEFDERFVAPGFDDGAWPAIALPHTWQTYETTGEVHPYIMRPSERDSTYWWYGWGCYRKRFKLDETGVDQQPEGLSSRGPAQGLSRGPHQKRLFLELDGVQKYCKVWLNGAYIGEHKGGFASFYFDISEHARFGGENVLCIAVNARRDDVFHTPPMNAGNWNPYGGITRDVRLVLKNALYIPFQGSYQHEGGTFVTTPRINEEAAAVWVKTYVKNDYPETREAELRTTLEDSFGQTLAWRTAMSPIASGEIHEFEQNDFVIPHPQLWSPESPNVYQAVSELLLNGEVVDTYLSAFGVRCFEWNYEENRGYLNGKQLHIHGTNRHQDFPWLGDAMPKWMSVRDLFDMRFGQGHNFARTCHYTQDELIYDLADHYGILICEEVPNIKANDFSEEIQRQQVVEMIRRDRNHPSIVFWSMGNETTDAANSAWAIAEDATRIIHERKADHGTAGLFAPHGHAQMDMENLLRVTIRGWTHEDVKDARPENGQWASTETWQHIQARVEGGSVRGRIDMPNGNMWIYAGHGADREYMNCPLLHINPKGWVDLYRIPKYIYYLWQAHYVDEPMVFIHPHFWQQQYAGQTKDIVVDSNCDEVTLSINGEPFDTLRLSPQTFHTATFENVPIEAGVLHAEGKRDGFPAVAAATQVTLAGPPAALRLEASHVNIPAARDSVVLLTAEAVDANGVPVQGFRETLEWEVTGPARLISPPEYTTDIDRRHSFSGTFYMVTPVCALIRAAGDPGEITATIRAKDVAPGVCTIIAEAAPLSQGLAKEIPLDDAGRGTVAHAPLREISGRDSGPMRNASEVLHWPPGESAAAYRERLVEYLRERNPEVLAQEPGTGALLDVLTSHLAANGGVLVADDYTYRALQFNDYCALAAQIPATGLPESFTGQWREYLASELIRKGHPWTSDLPLFPKTAEAEAVESDTKAADLFTRWYPEAASVPGARSASALEAFKLVNTPVIPLEGNYVLFEAPIKKGSSVLRPEWNWLTRFSANR